MVCIAVVASAVVAAAASTPFMPTILAPGVISSGAHDSAPAFGRDGRTVYFGRSTPGGSAIVVSRLTSVGWAKTRIAAFSGRWNDLEPTFSPDGRYIVFVSSRPVSPGGPTLDGVFNGTKQPGQGGNLWKVTRTSHGWSRAVRLPDNINAGTAIYAPSISALGTLFFMKPDPATGRFRLYSARVAGTGYADPQPLPFSTGTSTDVDPAVAPDESFMIFGSGRAPAKGMDLFITWRTSAGWSEPVHLGGDVNSPGSDAEPRLSPDLETLYFSSERLAMQTFPRSSADAQRDVHAAASWNNGLYNIWSVPLKRLLKRTQGHADPPS